MICVVATIGAVRQTHQRPAEQAQNDSPQMCSRACDIFDLCLHLLMATWTCDQCWIRSESVLRHDYEENLMKH